MRTDLVVVHSPVGGGHKSAALATAEAARARGLRVEVLDAFDFAPKIAGDAYLAAHLAGQSATPELYGRMYEAANRRGALEPLRCRFDSVLFGALADRVRALAPRAVVATHHLPLVVLGRARRKGRLAAPLVGVVTDYTAHACWAERGVDAWAVPCEAAARELAGHGAVPSRIRRTGIPVREAFGKIAPVAPTTGPIPVLVTSGGFGVGPVRAVVRSLAATQAFAITIVCGAARELEGAMRREVGARARVVGFEKDMPSRIAEAALVVGKAGGLTVSEVLTAGRAMLVVGAVPGNEKRNESFVVDGGAGVAVAPGAVGAVAAELVRAGLVPWMGERARRLVLPDAAARVIDLALGLGVQRCAA